MSTTLLYSLVAGFVLLAMLLCALIVQRLWRATSQRFDANLAALSQERDQLRSELATATADSAQLAANLARTQGEVAASSTRLQELKDTQPELQRLRDSVSQLSTRNQNLVQTLEAREAELLSKQAELKQLQEETSQLKASNASLQTDQNNLNQRMQEQRAWVEEQTKAFENRISVLTSNLFKKQTEDAQKQSRRSLDEALTPFRNSLGEFKTQVEGFARDQLKERQGLVGQIKTLADVHGNLSAQTEALTKALTQQNKQAGDWGEVQLSRYLESAGFEEGVHYKKQVSVKSADGAVQRPDVVLYLPEDRQVIIDSKVSIKAWTQANQTEDEAERKLMLRQHVDSIRRHVADLSSKDYTASPDISTLDFVVMFVPVEAAYIAAAGDDPHLFQEAFRQGVIIASPTLLLAILKLVSSLWNMHKQEEHAADILELAGKIHSKLMTFAKNFEDVGARLDSAKKAYDDSYGQLASGRGNALKMLTDMEKHGITVRKQLPTKMQRATQLEDATEPEPLPPDNAT